MVDRRSKRLGKNWLKQAQRKKAKSAKEKDPITPREGSQRVQKLMNKDKQKVQKEVRRFIIQEDGKLKKGIYPCKSKVFPDLRGPCPLKVYGATTAQCKSNSFLGELPHLFLSQ